MQQTLGIIGAGNIAKAVAKHALNAGYEVILSNSKGPETLQETIATLGQGAIKQAQARRRRRQI